MGSIRFKKMPLTHCAQWNFTSNGVGHFTKVIWAHSLKNSFVPALEVNFRKKLPQLVALHIFQSSYLSHGESLNHNILSHYHLTHIEQIFENITDITKKTSKIVATI